MFQKNFMIIIEKPWWLASFDLSHWVIVFTVLSVQLLAEKNFFFHQGFTLSKAEEPLQDMDLQKKEEKYEKLLKNLKMKSVH